MAKAYLCPHCRARNRFKRTEINDGVVRCGACGQAFLLPDFAPPASPVALSTAIVDSRTGQDASRLAFDARDTAIVDTRPPEDFDGPAEAGHPKATIPPLMLQKPQRRVDLSPPGGHRLGGSETPTLVVVEKAEARVRSETPTIVMLDGANESGELRSPDIGRRRPRSAGPALPRGRPKKPAAVEMPGAGVLSHGERGTARRKDAPPPGSERPTLVVLDAPLLEAPRPEHRPPGPSEGEAAAPAKPAPLTGLAGRDEDSGPLTLSAGETKRSTADTQPTNPPPEYIEARERQGDVPAAAGPELPRSARLPERVDDPMAGTQPSVATDRRVRGAGIAFFALVSAGVVVGAFYYAQVRTETTTERSVLEWLAERAAIRTGDVVSAVSSAMLAGRPDQARHLVTAFGAASSHEHLFVVRPDLTHALMEDDWTTYAAVVAAACDEEGVENRAGEDVEEARAVVARWRSGPDPRSRGLRSDVCERAPAVPERAAPKKAELPSGFADHVAGPRDVVSWVDDHGDERSQFVVQPVAGTAKCRACHVAAGPEAPIGYVVVRSPLGPVDELLAGGRGTLLRTGLVTAGLVVLLLLLAFRLFGRTTAAP